MIPTLFLLLAPLGDPVLIESDEVAPVELGADARTFRFVADFEGVLHLWVESELAPALHVEGPRELRAEDDGDRRRAPYLGVPVRPDDTLVIAVADDPHRAGPATAYLHVVAAPETGATRAAVEAARQSVARLRELRAAGDHVGASALAAETLAELLAAPGADRCDAVAQGLVELGAAELQLGDPPYANEAMGRALGVLQRLRPPDHVALLRLRANVALTSRVAGDLDGALRIGREAVRIHAPTLPEEHPDLLRMEREVALALRGLSDLRGALEIEERLVAIAERTREPDDPELVFARGNLASTLAELGDLRRALPLFQGVHASLSRTCAPDDPMLQRARLDLGAVLAGTGDLQAARALEERALESLSRTLPDDHPMLQDARQNLAHTLHSLGDLHAARELYEKALEVRARLFGDEHPELQRTRRSYAGLLRDAGEPEAAVALLEEVLEVQERVLGEDSRELQASRTSLAETLARVGRPDESAELYVRAVEALARIVPDDHSDLLDARLGLAAVRRTLGETGSARTLEEGVVATRSGTLPDDHASVVHARHELAATLVLEGETAAARETALRFARGLRTRLARAILLSSPGEAERRMEGEDTHVSWALSFATSPRVADDALRREAVAILETSRAGAVVASAFLRTVGEDTEVRRLRELAREASEELARLARTDASRDELAGMRRSRDAALRALANRVEPTAFGREPTVEALAAALAPGEAAVGYRRFTRFELDAEGPAPLAPSEVLLAHVILPDGTLRLHVLGPVHAVEERVERWRASLGTGGAARGLGVSSAGGGSEREASAALRELVWDPLADSLEGIERVVVAADGALLLVPLDALVDGDGRVGDRLRLEPRATLWELLLPESRREAGALLALGGADFDRPESAQENREPTGGARVEHLRAPGAFAPLPGTADEVWSLGALWREHVGGDALVLVGRDASRANLVAGAPSARVLHVATHGWFAPESVASSAARSADGRGPSAGLSLEAQVLGASPLVLCGLALAGVNGEPDADGRVAGAITAEELASLDLSRCELAVLSACDTSVGHVRSAGQGVASLRRALHVAGTRSVITSLWKVDDAATRELMERFYTALWADGLGKSDALWKAKSSLRAEGRPVRDWAAWILSGEPD